MKKILAAILAVAMVMSFAACGDSSSKSDSSSKASSSSAADSSAADSSAADSSAAESTGDSTADASAVVGAWTISKVIKADGTEQSLEDFASENNTTVEAIQATSVFADGGKYTSYCAGQNPEEGTYTFDGKNGETTDSKGDKEQFVIEDGKMTVSSSKQEFKLVAEKNDSFDPNAQAQSADSSESQAEGGEEQPAEQQGEEQPAEQQGEEQAAE